MKSQVECWISGGVGGLCRGQAGRSSPCPGPTVWGALPGSVQRKEMLGEKEEEERKKN